MERLETSRASGSTSMKPWKSNWVLALIFIGVMATLLKSLVSPASAQRDALPALAKQYYFDSQQLSQMGVEFQPQELNSFSANARRFQRDAAIARADNSNHLRVRQHLPAGSYMLTRDRTHEQLMACLTPQGQSIGSYDAYLRHSHSQSVNPGRAVTWLLGFGPVRDARCLWVTLSVPLDAGDVAQRELLLERAFLTGLHPD